jgi:hypothetical protein
MNWMCFSEHKAQSTGNELDVFVFFYQLETDTEPYLMPVSFHCHNAIAGRRLTRKDG